MNKSSIIDFKKKLVKYWYSLITNFLISIQDKLKWEWLSSVYQLVI